MREELTDTQRWRASIQKYSQRSQSCAAKRWSENRLELDPETVDAALTEEEISTEKPNATDIIKSLASQLDLLEQQREHLQNLLKQAQTVN